MTELPLPLIDAILTKAEAGAMFPAPSNSKADNFFMPYYTLDETRNFCTGYRALEAEKAAAVEDERLEALKKPDESIENPIDEHRLLRLRRPSARRPPQPSHGPWPSAAKTQ